MPAGEAEREPSPAHSQFGASHFRAGRLMQESLAGLHVTPRKRGAQESSPVSVHPTCLTAQAAREPRRSGRGLCLGAEVQGVPPQGWCMVAGELGQGVGAAWHIQPCRCAQITAFRWRNTVPHTATLNSECASRYQTPWFGCDIFPNSKEMGASGHPGLRHQCDAVCPTQA